MSKYFFISTLLIAVVVAGYYILGFSQIGEQFGLATLKPVQGGTGISSAVAGDVGKVLKVLDDSPFTFELATDNTGGGGGAGNSKWATTTNLVGIYPNSATAVVIGGTATTVNGTELEVTGNLYVSASSTLQNFTFLNATGSKATTTTLFSTTASSTNLFATAIAGGNVTSSGLGTFANLLAQSSSTIGAGTQATGLTISGGATTTGFLVVQGSGTSTFTGGISASRLTTTATSTFAGLQVTSQGLQVATLASCDTIDTDASGNLVCGSDTGGTPNSKWATSTSDTLAISPNSALRVGIGTTTPRWALQIASSTGSQLTLTDQSAGVNLKHWSLRSAGGNLYFATSSDTTFATNTQPVLTLSSTGNFGVGTTAPAAALSALGDAYITGTLHVAEGGYRLGSTGLITANSLFFADPGAASISLQTAGGILSPASSTIGAGTQATGLTIAGNATTTLAIKVQGTEGSATSTFSHAVQLGVTARDSMLAITPGRAYSGSESVGGVQNINVGTTDTIGLVLYNNHTGTSRLLSLVCDAVTYSGNCLNVRSDGTATAVNISGAPTGQGLLKVGANGAGDANAAIGSFDASTSGFLGQVFFFKCGTNPTCWNMRTSANAQVLTASAEGRFGWGTTTPQWQIQIASSTGPQFTLTDAGAGSNLKHWTFRSAGGELYIATSSDTYATSSKTALAFTTNGQPRFPYLVSCNTIDTDASGNLTCGTDEGGAGGGMDSKWATSSADTNAIHTANAFKVGIGSTTPWATLSVASTTYSHLLPLLSISTSTSDRFGQLLMVSATSSGITTTGARVAIGTTTLGNSLGSGFPLTVAGEIYSTKRYLSCDHIEQEAGQTSDTPEVASGCDFIFDEDVNGATGAVPGTRDPGGLLYLDLWCGVTASTAALCSSGNGAAMMPAAPAVGNTRFASASSSPVFEAIVELDDDNLSATTSRTFVGFGAVNADGDFAESEAIFNAGNYFGFVASSSGTWVAVAAVANGVFYQQQDTGIAATSTAAFDWQKLRVHVRMTTARGTTTVTYFINDIQVASIETLEKGTSFPARLNPIIMIGSPTGNGLGKHIRIASIRAWADIIPDYPF